MATGKGRLYHANGDIYEGVIIANLKKKKNLRIGKSINQKDMESIFMLMEPNMKVLGIMICKMAPGLKHGLMVQSTKESTSME